MHRRHDPLDPRTVPLQPWGQHQLRAQLFRLLLHGKAGALYLSEATARACRLHFRGPRQRAPRQRSSNLHLAHGGEDGPSPASRGWPRAPKTRGGHRASARADYAQAAVFSGTTNAVQCFCMAEAAYGPLQRHPPPVQKTTISGDSDRPAIECLLRQSPGWGALARAPLFCSWR